MGQERERLERQRKGKEDWRLWGPYLSERAWGTVREDYSPHGEAWEYFSHEQSRSRAYRWSEDGIGGISDDKQRLCLAFAFWNGKDPILKERLFGLTGNEGNHGEDVKESFFYLDATPSHSLLKYLYKYPQKEYPYTLLVEENRSRPRGMPSFNLTDTGVFSENRYWDIEITYAKERTDSLFARLRIFNRGPETATLHLLPTLWFRNTWSWGTGNGSVPLIEPAESGKAEWAVRARNGDLGDHFLYGRQAAKGLFTGNETNSEHLFSSPNRTPYVKDAFHRFIVDGDADAVDPGRTGSKFAAWHTIECEAGGSVTVDLSLSPRALKDPFASMQEVLETREREADEFFSDLLPGAAPEDALIHRQAVAGMIWSRQFYQYNVGKWLDGDEIAPPGTRSSGRNSRWRHLDASDVISVPDKWEYPWFAAWDLAYHCMAFARFDSDFAKRQI
ncbi:MAG TPA: glucosidase, partial [Synergistetes bacterium]|nr:glucosidase [Synergistota bacterium]